MNDTTLIERVRKLTRRIEELKMQEARIKARETVENIMSKHQYLLSLADTDTIVNTLWAQHTEDTRAEFWNSGIYDGLKSIGRAYSRIKEEPGRLLISTTCTPVIEVAGDGLTAKGVWHSPGNETYTKGKYAHDPGTGQYVVKDPDAEATAFWVYQRFAADFILEDNEWRFWHFHSYELFHNPFDTIWGTYVMRRIRNGLNGGTFNMTMPPADRPSSDPWEFGPEATVVLQPHYPLPYDTFKNTFSY